jgi:hypothetical protein
MNTPEKAYKEMNEAMQKSYNWQGHAMKKPARATKDLYAARDYAMAYLLDLGERIHKGSVNYDLLKVDRQELGDAYEEVWAEIEKLERRLVKILPDFK